MLPWIALVGAALGAVKANEEKKAFDAQKDQAATQSMWSPWTGQGFGQLGPAPSAMGSIMQGAMAGAMMQNEMGKTDKVDKPTTAEPSVNGQVGPYAAQQPAPWAYNFGLPPK